MDGFFKCLIQVAPLAQVVPLAFGVTGTDRQIQWAQIIRRQQDDQCPDSNVRALRIGRRTPSPAPAPPGPAPPNLRHGPQPRTVSGRNRAMNELGMGQTRPPMADSQPGGVRQPGASRAANPTAMCDNYFVFAGAGIGASLFQQTRAIFQAPSVWRWHTVTHLSFISIGLPPPAGVPDQTKAPEM